MSANERTVLTATEKSPIVSHEHRNRNHHRSRAPAGRVGQLAGVLGAMKPDPNSVYTRKQMAKILHMSERALMEKSRGSRAKIPSIRIGRNTVRYHWGTVLAALNANGKPCV